MFARAAELEALGANAAICLVIKVQGSTPQKVGAKMIVIDSGDDHGQIIGTIGGGAIEHLIRNKAVLAIRARKPQLIETSLRNELGMCCGGMMEVFIEPLKKRPQFICFGAGHIAQSLCPLALKLGYDVTVADERKSLLSHDAFLKVHHLNDTSSFAIKEMSFHDDSYIVVATHDHGLDQNIVESILPHKFKYGALVGSKRKALMTRKRLLAKGFLKEAIDRITCPAGIDIQAATAEEIALSILAQMTLIKNG